MGKTFEALFSEILVEIEQEEIEQERINKAIIANGCPCSNKIGRIGLFSKKHYFECPICFKQFDVKGREIQ